MNDSSTNAMCMFCGDSGPDTPFDDEHIIPESIRGSWKLNNCVCRQCNNALGTEVDARVWGIADIVNAHDKLAISYDANTVFKNHYQAKAQMGGREVPYKAQWTPDVIRLHPYPDTLPDGVRIYPLSDYKKGLHKNLSRKEGYTRSSVDELLSRIDKAIPGDKVEHPAQQQHFMKGRPEKITVEIVPKDNDVGRLVAKIAFEFLYVLTAPFLLKWPAVAEPLRLYSRYGTPDDTIRIRRVKSDRPDFEAFHSITCHLQGGIVIVYVTLFGYIEYELLMRVAPSDTFLHQIRAETGCPDLVGFNFEQDLDSRSCGLRAWLANGEFVPMNVW